MGLAPNQSMPLATLSRAICGVTATLLLACAPGPDPAMPGTMPMPPGLTMDAWRHALAAHQRVAREGRTRSDLLTVIDFTLPSNQRRLWVVDLGTGQVLAHEHVAHGVRSGATYPESFSNRLGSNQSSVGTFITGRRYRGIRGISLRLEGLDPGINDQAMRRGIVLHGSRGVSEERAQRGAVGRTEGCPAVSMTAARRLVPLLEGGTVVFAWYPEARLLSGSRYLDAALLAASPAGGRNLWPAGGGR